MGKRVSELESLKNLETEKEAETETETEAETKTETEAETKTETTTRKVKMIRTVCRPEGSFQSNRTYEVSEKLAETFIKNKFAEKAK